MIFDQEYTAYFLQGSVTSHFLQEKNSFQISSGNKSVYSFTKLTVLAVELNLQDGLSIKKAINYKNLPFFPTL